MAHENQKAMTERQRKQKALLDQALAQPGVREVTEVYGAARGLFEVMQQNAATPALIITATDSSSRLRDLVT